MRQSGSHFLLMDHYRSLQRMKQLEKLFKTKVPYGFLASTEHTAAD